MYFYVAAELGEVFNFEQALQYGMLLVVWHSKIPKETIKRYVGTYFIEKVRMMELSLSKAGDTKNKHTVSFIKIEIEHTTDGQFYKK
jgi:hypothetical protein